MAQGIARPPVRGGAKGATTSADVTSTANGADHQGLDVAVQGTVPVSGTFWQATQPTSNAASSQADGHSLSIGATGDASTANTVIGRLKKLISLLPTALGQTTKSASLPVVLPSDQTVAVSGTLTSSVEYDTAPPLLTDGQTHAVRGDKAARALVATEVPNGAYGGHALGTRALDVQMRRVEHPGLKGRPARDQALSLLADEFTGALDTTKWTSTVANGGTVQAGTFGDVGSLYLLTNTTANGAAAIQSIAAPRMVAGTQNHFECALMAEAQNANNTARWGAFSTTDGYFFQMVNNAVSVGYLANGSVTIIASADWIEAGAYEDLEGYGVTGWNNSQFFRFEIYWDAYEVAYIVNGVVVHVLNRYAATSQPRARTSALPARFETTNSAGATASSYLKLLYAGIDRLGAPAVDSSGQLQLASGGVVGSAVPTRAVQVAGTDGTSTTVPKVLTAAPASNDPGWVVRALGTFWQATQPVSGTFWQATQPVSAASLPLPSGASTETTLLAQAQGVVRTKKEYDIGTTAIYVGTAALGTATSAAAWTIKKISLTAGLPTSTTWTGLTAVWDNRASESYS